MYQGLLKFVEKRKLTKEFKVEFKKFNKMSDKTGKRFFLNWGERFPCLYDKTLITEFEPHYVYHTAWAARKLAEIKPIKHIDISSSLYFNVLTSAFVPIKFYDYRPANIRLSNFETGSIDLTSIDFDDNSVNSLSCMHVVEHVGLGRYGDELDPDGDIKAINEIKRVINKNGHFLFVVPVGRPRIEFNAHRIYSYDMIIGFFNEFELKEFSLIGKNFREDGIAINATREQSDHEEWGCGCFWFIKR
jgi:SAM-dependent methyltransferase